MNVFVIEVLGGVVPADQIIDDVRMAHALLDRFGVAKIELHEHDPAEISGDFQIPLCVLIAEGNDDITPLTSESVDDISAKEASCSKDGGCMTSAGRSTSLHPYYGLPCPCNGNVLEVPALCQSDAAHWSARATASGPEGRRC